MKLVLGIAIFTTTFALAYSTTYLFNDRSNFHNCPRFEGIDPSERFFTLDEGKKVLGRKIRYTGDAKFSNNAGRVAGLDLIDNDRFFIIVDWEVTPDNGGPGLRWYSKDFYERLLIAE